MNRKAHQKFADKAQFDPFQYLMELAMDVKQPQGIRMQVSMELLPYLRPKAKHTALDWPLGIPKDATPQEAAKIVLQAVDIGGMPMEHGVMMLAMIEKAAGFAYATEMEELRQAIAALSAPDGQAVSGGPTPTWLKMKTLNDSRATHAGNTKDHPAE